jgi:hypothetical protein
MGLVKFNLEESSNSPSSSARWTKIDDKSYRLLIRETAGGREIAAATLSWLEEGKIFTSEQGDLLIYQSSQIWSRDRSRWRAWMVRDGWAVESATWKKGLSDGFWELIWKKMSQDGNSRQEREWRNRDLERVHGP